MELRPINPDDETDTEICCHCFKDIKPFNTNIVEEYGKSSIYCNECYNILILKL